MGAWAAFVTSMICVLTEGYSGLLARRSVRELGATSCSQSRIAIARDSDTEVVKTMGPSATVINDTGASNEMCMKGSQE